MKLCLGTVQFGLDYGIINQKKPKLEDSIEMLEYAIQNELDTIDTASAYGTAEIIVGEFIKKNTSIRNGLTIISKSKPNILDNVQEKDYYVILKENLLMSLNRLNTDYLDCYLLHSSRYIYNEEIIKTLYRFKTEGYVKKIGVSIYEPEEALRGIENKKIEFLQIPFSIFDQRMLEADILKKAFESGTQLHARSAFIQGLILLHVNELPPFLEKAKPIIIKIDELCKKYNISRISLAMAFVKQHKEISHLVFGVDNLTQLKDDIELFRNDISNEIINSIAYEFKGIEADIVMPSLWKK